ncbi:hypothetical protein SAMD00019534_126030 [Acytostelium subglobosum LB1]|uniref:hypothetical protein n=1 Tax=Acytostelium subglobosum LB1 TaxID=1410327 RepID=UPI000644E00D|nr:hypothetical protein SAMD00019534_126030 [Acytostelium subglobosum LB1]GAM29427.1 hypothetical protein SAMD00019534_126030 [Acytostelium subglobosum LB1]|eukprot:XP_012747632.1 hypothetical protein SAMD00019534_126030 [Acytostelium subglobosum LB1]
MSRKAVAVLKGAGETTGVVTFTQENQEAPVLVQYNITNLPKGDHGFHVHQFGDTTNGCVSAGPHYNPFGKAHGAPTADIRHAGDLGNIVSGDDNVANSTLTDKIITLFGENSIVGRTMIVHADKDDFGLGGFEDSLTTGHAGARLACGVIGLAQ